MNSQECYRRVYERLGGLGSTRAEGYQGLGQVAETKSRLKQVMKRLAN